MPTTKPKLTTEQLALLFAQLHRLELAGLPVDQMFAVLASTDINLKIPLSLMQQFTSKGQAISEAGFKAGIFTDTQKTLIHAGESSGQLANVYGRLTAYYAGVSKRSKQIKSRLYLPAFVLIIASLVQPLPALIANEINALGYFQQSVGRLIVIGSAAYLLVKLPSILAAIGVEKSWHRLQLRLPFVANWVSKRQLNDFFFVLGMMLESGLSFQVALPKAVATIKNSYIREKFNLAYPFLTSGLSVTDTLKTVSIIDSTMLQIINSSEQSGKLASGILQYCKLEAETISLQDDSLAEWLPRLVYSVIAIWMGYSILGGASIATRVPADL